MKTHTIPILSALLLCATTALGQAIDVTPSGVSLGATASGANGAVLRQEGSEVTLWTKSGLTPPELRVVVTPGGDVGIGTPAPAAKLEVAGDSLTTGTATVGALVVGTSPIFTEGYFESAPQPIPGPGNIASVAHGMSGTPRFITVTLLCVTNEYGWAPGDQIILNSIHMISNNSGMTTGFNDSVIRSRQHGSIAVHRMDSTGANAYINAVNWRLVFRAWR